MHGAPVEVKIKMEFHKVVVGASLKRLPYICWCNLCSAPTSVVEASPQITRNIINGPQQHSLGPPQQGFLHTLFTFC